MTIKRYGTSAAERPDGIFCLYAEYEKVAAECERLREAMKLQATAARAGMDAATRASSIRLELATQARAESSPDVLASERTMNAMLTEENEALREDAELFRIVVSTCDALDANSFDKSNQPGTLRIVCKHKTETYPELRAKIVDFLKGYKARVDAARGAK